MPPMQTSAESYPDPSLSLYDVMLKLQADAGIAQERDILLAGGWSKVKNVLDFGCGNGYFLSLLKQYVLPDGRFGGIDFNAAFLDRAQKHYGSTATFSDSLESYQATSADPDALILRLVLHHLPDFAATLRVLLSSFTNLERIYIVNPLDKYFSIHPALLSFQSDLAQVRQEPKKRRDIHDEVSAIIGLLGFEEDRRKECIIRNSNNAEKNQLFAYMFATASINGRTSPSDETLAELVDWLLNPESTAQYGLICSTYVRTKQ